MSKWVCSACGAEFATKHQLIGHLLSAHSDEEEYEESEYVYFCKYCNSEFSNYEELVEHLIDNHIEDIKNDKDLTEEQRTKILELVEAKRKLEEEQKKEQKETTEKTQKKQKTQK